MLPIPENYLRSPCEVKAMDNKPILTGSIGRIADNELQIVNLADQLPVVHCNTTVRVSIFNNALGFRVLVGVVYLSTPELIRITDVQSETDYEKRNFFRVKVEIETKAFPEDENGETRKDLPLSVKIQDLSLSGLFYTSTRKMEIGDRLSIQLTLFHSPVILSCKIVRKLVRKQSDEDGYGCEFLNHSGPTFDLLCKYLFDCQREQIRMIKEKQT